MTATEDFFKKKMAGQTTGNNSGTSATDEFFKKKIAEKSAVTKDTNIITPPESTTSPGDLSVKVEDIQKPLISAVKVPSEIDTAYSGRGTTSIGNGIKIDQSPYKMEQQKIQAKNDEELRVKQADLVMGAEQLGQMYVDKLSPQDKDILISGLKNKEASLAYQGQAKKMSELVGQDISPKLTQAGPNDTTDSSLSIDPRDPANFAFYEKKKRDFDMIAPDGTKIKAYNKTAVDDPVENINIALNMGRDQVMGTIGAIGEWMGVSDGSLRKNAENSQKWEELDFNKPLDDTNANVFDSRFWTQKVPQSIPFMVALVPAGIAGAAAGGEVAGMVGLGQLGTYLTTAGFAGISSRFAESIAEGAGVYAELKDNGVSDTTASKEAFDTAKQNMAMVFSDMAQMAVTFAPVKKIPGLQNMLGKVLIPTAKFTFDATSEGGEEVFQGYVQQLNTAQGLGKKPQSILEYLNSDEARETFKLGAATGLAFGGVGVAKDAYDNFIDRATSQVEMVQEAIEKNDIDFIPKMEVLEEKDAISRDTVDAVKTLLDINLKNEGSSYEEWMTNGLQERKEKIEENTNKVQEVSKKEIEKETTQKQSTYRERLKESGMDDAEIEKTLTIEKAFGLDIPQSEFINEFVSKEIGRNFTYNTDLAGRYSPEVQEVIKTAKENYKNLEQLKTDPTKTPIELDYVAGDTVKYETVGGDMKEGVLEDYISKVDGSKRLVVKDNGVNYFTPNFRGKINTTELDSKPTELKTTPEVQEKIDDISKMNTEDTLQKYTPEEIKQIQYEEEQKIIKQAEEDNLDIKKNEKISEDSELTYGDLEVLAQRITNTLRDPKARFGLKRGKNSDMSTNTEKYLKTSTEATIEALTEEFQSLKNGLKEIADYYAMNKKHPYTQQKLRELQNILSKGEYDFLEQSDIFTTTINPYLYEGKKQVPKNVREITTRGARQSSKGSDTNGGNDTKQEQDKVEKLGTGKASIINAVEKVDAVFKEPESKYPKFAEIDTKTAMEASRGTSFDPEKRGEQRIREFKKEMEDLYDEMIENTKTEEQIEIVKSEVLDLSRKLADRQNAINYAEGGVVSSMIAGPARFPVERMRKKNESIRKKYEDYIDFKERAKNSILKKLKGQEIESVGGPIEALKLEIKNLTENRDKAKIINATIKKYKTQEAIYDALISSGISEKLAKEASTPTRSSGKIETIYLININNRIKDRETKLEKMQKMEAIKGTEDETKVLYSFDGGKVIDNRGADRVQIILNDRPNSDTLYSLKKKGWKWSPKNSAWQRFRNSGSVNSAREIFPEVIDKKFQSTKLTTKILNKLGDRETVSKEFVMNLTNSGDIKQVEKDIIRSLLETEGDKINVAEFKVKVESELLPLTRVSSLDGEPMYEQVVLPEYIRGDVQDYSENVYESPIKVSAGKVHFGEEAENYFGHTRIEDMADGITRRIIEVQSDLYQRGRLDDEKTRIDKKIEMRKGWIEEIKNDSEYGKKEREFRLEDVEEELQILEKQKVGQESLKQYNDPTAHFRMIREELAQASQDKIEKVQFPTGETAMNIEGLSNRVDKYVTLDNQLINEGNIEKGKVISIRDIDGNVHDYRKFIITENTGGGTFKAVDIMVVENSEKGYKALQKNGYLDGETGEITLPDIVSDSFINDVKGDAEALTAVNEVDKNNPIYKFYEKEVSRYVKNNYNAKPVTDSKGVSWYEVEVTEDMQNQVLAFQNQGDQSNAWIYDIIGEKYGVVPFAQEKIDIQEAYIEAINLAPKGWKVRVEDTTPENYLENVVAYADLATKEIVIATNEARKSTAAHESVHAALSELTAAQRKIIVDTARKQWETETKKKLTDDQAEEFLAEEFKYFIENKKYKTKTLFGRLREFISKLLNTIKGVFGKDNKIKTFYEDILAGKIVDTETRVGKKFQSMDEKTKKMYDDIDAEAFGNNTTDGDGPKLGYKYQKGEKEKTPGKGWVSFKEFARKSLVPIDSVIGSIDPGLREKMGKFEYGVANSEIMKESRIVMESLIKKIGDKKESEDYRILDIALKNGDGEVVGYYAKKLGIQEELTEVRKVLDKIHEEATKVGLDIKYLEEYFPRTVNDSIGLLSYIYKTEYGSQIQNAIKLSEIEAGHDLTDEEKAVIANKMLRGYKVAGITLTPPGNVKARSIDEINKELNPFYNDSMDSLAIYIQGMNENIESRKLFGKGENLQNSIGMYILDLLQKGKITPVQEIQLTKALQSRFATPIMDAWVAGYKGIAYITTMGSPISAISQIQDLAFSLYENGFLTTGSEYIKALTGNQKISKDDLGISSIVQEFKDPSKMQGAVTKVFKLVGLEYMDSVGKETLINGTYRKIQKQVLRGNMSELEKFEFTPEETKEILEAFKSGKVNENIKYVLFSKLMKYQPLTRSQMPEYYNTSGNLKILYMLKSFLVKQIDVFRQEAFNEISQGVKTKNKQQVIKGMSNLIKLTIALMFMGGLTDTLKNLLLGRPFNMTDLMVDNILKLMGFSKYTVYQVKEKTLSDGLLSIVIPPFNFFNDVIVDIYSTQKDKDPLTNPLKAQSINNIPVGGKLYYWWFGKGADKSDKKRETAAKAGTIKTSTKKVAPFSESNGFKSTNGFKDKLNFK